MPSDMEKILNNPVLQGRALMLRMGNDPKGLLEYVGDGFPSFSASSRISMLGNDPSRQPDPRYGLKAYAAYRETYAEQAPRLELVEAVIMLPGQVPRRNRYERLLLPWRRGGAEFVSGVSVLRSIFDVAAEA
jgi:hypothetical protein